MTNQTQHTAGEWQYQHEVAYGRDIYATRGETEIWVASVNGPHDGSDGFPTADECKANAALIAAAPETAEERDKLREINAELLAALEGVAGDSVCMKGFHEQFRAQIHAAIAKARAQP